MGDEELKVVFFFLIINTTTEISFIPTLLKEQLETSAGESPDCKVLLDSMSFFVINVDTVLPPWWKVITENFDSLFTNIYTMYANT